MSPRAVFEAVREGKANLNSHLFTLTTFDPVLPFIHGHLLHRHWHAQGCRLWKLHGNRVSEVLLLPRNLRASRKSLIGVGQSGQIESI
jgi:hypothetical protein